MKIRIILVLAVITLSGSAIAQPTCNPTPFVNWGGSGLPVGASECVIVCPGTTTLLCVGPGLGPHQIPLIGIMFGCRPIVTLCDQECPFTTTGIYWTYDPLGWTYDPATGTFCNVIIGLEPGCICVTLEGFLAAEMGQLSAIAGDGRVDIRWNTLSENNLECFELTRRAEYEQTATTIGSIPAQNTVTGADYSFRDGNVTNGVRYSYSLVVVNIDGSREETGLIAEAVPGGASLMPGAFALYQNYPNPFNPSSRIRFDLSEASLVHLTVYDVNGKIVATLVDDAMNAGSHEVEFNAGNLPSGVYYYRLDAGDFSATRSMLLVK